LRTKTLAFSNFTQNLRSSFDPCQRDDFFPRPRIDAMDAQQSALKAAGAGQIFAEKVSGAETDRKQLAKAIAASLRASWLNQISALAARALVRHPMSRKQKVLSTLRAAAACRS
jgi:hypothetical protein